MKRFYFKQWLRQGTEGRGKGKFDEEMQKIVINKGLVNSHWRLKIALIAPQICHYAHCQIDIQIIFGVHIQNVSVFGLFAISLL